MLFYLLNLALASWNVNSCKLSHSLHVEVHDFGHLNLKYDNRQEKEFVELSFFIRIVEGLACSSETLYFPL